MGYTAAQIVSMFSMKAASSMIRSDPAKERPDCLPDGRDLIVDPVLSLSVCLLSS